ncbi:olfactory receptor 5AP2-like [Pleurodeles waltl]|uniref:olfactory receptor 5AP2-like n=1 Tax=Pleurodeles waltl TaxID=8319 RepID=UPI003709A7C8
MQTTNRTRVTEFILLGLTENPKLHVPLFMLFLLIYTFTLLGNIGIMTLVKLNHKLHTPMYILLCNLSLADIGYSSASTPHMLVNFLSKRKTISFLGCAIQVFFNITMGSSEVFLLTLMAYDRYVAICKPLLYSLIMSNTACIKLVIFIYLLAISNSLTHAIFAFKLPFCDSNVITHFFCDVPPILMISCADTTLNELLLVSVAGGLILLCLTVILISYAYIVAAILKIGSSDGRWKTFSTCSSHFVCMIIFLGPLVFMYAQPSSSHSMAQDRVSAVFFTVIIPMLNPLIYSLRNQEVKRALRRSMGMRCF